MYNINNVKTKSAPVLDLPASYTLKILNTPCNVKSLSNIFNPSISTETFSDILKESVIVLIFNSSIRYLHPIIIIKIK